MSTQTNKEQLLEGIRCLSSVVENYNNYIRSELGFSNNYSIEERGKGPGKLHKEHYPFIPTYDISSLLRCLYQVRDYIFKKKKSHRNLNFFDCGCGVGNIMLLVKYMEGFMVS